MLYYKCYKSYIAISMYTEQDNWHIKQEVTARTVCIHGIHVYGIYGMQAARTLTTSGIAGGGGGGTQLTVYSTWRITVFTLYSCCMTRSDDKQVLRQWPYLWLKVYKYRTVVVQLSLYWMQGRKRQCIIYVHVYSWMYCIIRVWVFRTKAFLRPSAGLSLDLRRLALKRKTTYRM